MPRKTWRVAAMLMCSVAALAVWPSDAAAQRRVVHTPAVRTVVVVAPFVGPYLAPRAYHPAFYSPVPWSRYGQYPYPPYGRRYYVYEPTGAVRLQITPNSAEVYVDGYFVGTVDRFDGVFQRLHLPVGEHELAFYLEGYRTLRHRVLFRPGATVRIIDTLEPLAPGDPGEARPTPHSGARPRLPPDGRGRPPAPYGDRRAAHYGSLSIRVQPADAVILVGGDRWDRPEGERSLIIQLPEGSHQVEVRKDGYRTYTTTIQIRQGQTLTLNVALTEGS